MFAASETARRYGNSRLRGRFTNYAPSIRNNTLSGFGDNRSAKTGRKILFGAGVAFASVVGYTLWAAHRRKQNEAKRARANAAIAQAQSAAAQSEAGRQEALGRAITYETQAKQLEAEAATLRAKAESAEASAQNVPAESAESAAAQGASAMGRVKQFMSGIPTWALVAGVGALGFVMLRR